MAQKPSSVSSDDFRAKAVHPINVYRHGLSPMFVEFDTAELISITEIDDCFQQAGFFANLGGLVPSSAIIGVGCYGPHPKVLDWFKTLPLVEVPDAFNFRYMFEIYREPYPNGGAFYFAATAENLARIADLATAVSSPELLSDHVIGYVGQRPLFMFHDWDELLIVPEIESNRIESFCRSLGVGYRRIPNPQLL